MIDTLEEDKWSNETPGCFELEAKLEFWDNIA